MSIVFRSEPRICLSSNPWFISSYPLQPSYVLKMLLSAYALISKSSQAQLKRPWSLFQFSTRNLRLGMPTIIVLIYGFPGETSFNWKIANYLIAMRDKIEGVSKGASKRYNTLITSYVEQKSIIQNFRLVTHCTSDYL